MASQIVDPIEYWPLSHRAKTKIGLLDYNQTNSNYPNSWEKFADISPTQNLQILNQNVPITQQLIFYLTHFTPFDFCRDYTFYKYNSNKQLLLNILLCFIYSGFEPSLVYYVG